jgi:hypothetical protein
MSFASPALRRVIYVSRALPTGQDQGALLGEILGAARRNNERLGVTGALLYSDRHFAQVLEGPPEAIEELFEAIQCDARHDSIAVLEVAAPPARSFGAWSMAYVEQPGITSGEMTGPDGAQRLLGVLRAALGNSAAAAA